MKRAIVTGVTSGIGEALTHKLISGGASVVGLGRNGVRLDEMRESLGARFEPVTVDFAVDARRGAFATMAERGPFDLVVHNAAECLYQSPLGADPDVVRRMFEVNVFAGLELLRAVAPSVERGGLIVLLSSVTTRSIANEKFVPYAATKAALETFAEGLRLELNPRDIGVTVVLPGLVDTPIYGKFSGFERAKEKVRALIPEWLTPGDVADAITWIAARPSHVAIPELVIMPARQVR